MQCVCLSCMKPVCPVLIHKASVEPDSVPPGSAIALEERAEVGGGAGHSSAYVTSHQLPAGREAALRIGHFEAEVGVAEGRRR